MDRWVSKFDKVPDGDLTLCPLNGIAFQTDMTVSASYDEDYFNKCRGYEGQEIARKINAGRIAMVNKHAGSKTNVLDVGVGSGEFVQNRPYTYGFDINPVAVEWLKGWNRYSDKFLDFSAFTFWDVLEHVATPEDYLGRVRTGGHVFVSIPIFSDLNKIRESRHYRPGEHLYYFTEMGFAMWMSLHGFIRLERQDFETQAGRDSILSFAFQRVHRPWE